MDRAKLAELETEKKIKKVAWVFLLKKKWVLPLFFGGKKREICFLKWQFPSGLERLPRTVQRTERLRRLFTAKGERKPVFSFPSLLYIYFLLFCSRFVLYFVLFVLFFSRGKGDGVSQDQPNLERGKEK